MKRYIISCLREMFDDPFQSQINGFSKLMGWSAIIENCGSFILDLTFREDLATEVVTVRRNKENNVKRGTILVRKSTHNSLLALTTCGRYNFWMFVFLSLTCDLAIVNKALQTLKDVNECIFIRYVTYVQQSKNSNTPTINRASNRQTLRMFWNWVTQISLAS